MKIQIPKPCHEDMNKMSPQEKGLFCGSCQKVVIDFSSMTDTEIVDYFKKIGSQKTCGLFSTTQVNRTLQPQKEKIETPRRRFFFKELVAASVAFFLTSTTAKSQNDTTQVEYNQKIEMDSVENVAPPFFINGKVINGNEVLSKAIISIKGTEHKTTSLENGIFSFLISEDRIQNQDSIILVAEYEGLKTKETKVVISSTDNQFVFIDFAKPMKLNLEEIKKPIPEKSIIKYFELETITLGFVNLQPLEYSKCWIKGDIEPDNLETKLQFKLDTGEPKKLHKENVKEQDTNNQSKETTLIPHVSKWYTRARLYQNLKDLMRRTFV